GGPATAAQLSGASSVAFDGFGNMYIADEIRVRKVNTAGIITTIAGTSTGGYSGDGGAATSAEFLPIISIVIDGYGNLYLSDNGNQRVRKIDTAGIVTTFAGNGTAGYSGDGGSATNAEIFAPEGLGLDLNGNLYICDQNNNLVRKVSIACSTPNVQVVSSKDSICTGESITLLGVGASTYTWLPGGSTNP